MEDKREAPFQRVGEEAKKPQHKDNQNLASMQEARQGFVSYLVSAVSDLWHLGQSDKCINRDLEGRMCKSLYDAIVAYKSIDGVHLALFEDGDIIRLYNGRFYEPIDYNALQCLLGIVLEKLEVGNAYIVRSDKVIADFILKRMRNNADCRYSPNPSLLAFINGIYDVKQGHLLKPSPELQARYAINLPYEERDCPIWKKVLEEDLEQELIPILQEALGYVIGGPQLEKLIVFLGSGRNGKSTILNAFIGILGAENVSNFSISQITEASGQKIPPMANKIANLCTDSGNFIGKGDEGALKAYASGEPLMAKPLYRQPFLTQNYPRSIIAMNSLPATSDISDGYFRRFLIIPFNKQIPEDKVDISLDSKLRSEYIGIMHWILEGASRLCKQGRFTDSPLLKQAQEDYRKDADPVALYLDEKEIVATDSMRIKVAEAYRAFMEWCSENGYRQMTQKTFSNRLRAMKIKVEKKSGDMCAYMGNPFSDEAPF